MTPEQEERLGRMMHEHARKAGHTKMLPPNAKPKDTK